MKKLWKRIATACLATAMVFTLASCESGGITKVDATTYVKGILDQTYLGKADDAYLKLLDTTASEVEETYVSNLEVDASNFADYYLMESEVSEEVMDRIIALYKGIYAKTKYTVQPATKMDSGAFAVQVDVEALDIYDLVDAEFDAVVEAYNAEYPDDMTDEQYAEYVSNWETTILTLFEEKLAVSASKPVKSQVLQVKKDDEGVWDIPDEDYQNIDTLVNYF